MRFWAVFALRGIGQWQRARGGADRRVVAALERMLSDEDVAPGNWWSVGREALAMLGNLEPGYQAGSIMKRSVSWKTQIRLRRICVGRKDTVPGGEQRQRSVFSRRGLRIESPRISMRWAL
jgi:hypothetical protein